MILHYRYPQKIKQTVHDCIGKKDPKYSFGTVGQKIVTLCHYLTDFINK